MRQVFHAPECDAHEYQRAFTRLNVTFLLDQARAGTELCELGPSRLRLRVQLTPWPWPWLGMVYPFTWRVGCSGFPTHFDPPAGINLRRQIAQRRRPNFVYHSSIGFSRRRKRDGDSLILVSDRLRRRIFPKNAANICHKSQLLWQRPSAFQSSIESGIIAGPP